MVSLIAFDPIVTLLRNCKKFTTVRTVLEYCILWLYSPIDSNILHKIASKHLSGPFHASVTSPSSCWFQSGRSPVTCEWVEILRNPDFKVITYSNWLFEFLTTAQLRELSWKLRDLRELRKLYDALFRSWLCEGYWAGTGGVSHPLSRDSWRSQASDKP